jgi:hypothetical protein
MAPHRVEVLRDDVRAMRVRVALANGTCGSNGFTERQRRALTRARA